jgi:2'-5' RNA ligase
MRAFVAIGLPPSTREALAQLQQQLASTSADVRWSPAAQWHLTLKFMADLTEGQAVEVTTALTRVAASVPVFHCRLGVVGAFPSILAPRVVWVGVEEGQEAIKLLAARVEQICAAAGVPRETRDISPHVTLGRVRSSRGRRVLSEALQRPWAPPASWQVSTLRVYQSVLQAQGAKHTLLAECRLSASTENA